MSLIQMTYNVRKVLLDLAEVFANKLEQRYGLYDQVCGLQKSQNFNQAVETLFERCINTIKKSECYELDVRFWNQGNFWTSLF